MLAVFKPDIRLKGLWGKWPEAAWPGAKMQSVEPAHKNSKAKNPLGWPPFGAEVH